MLYAIIKNPGNQTPRTIYSLQRFPVELRFYIHWNDTNGNSIGHVLDNNLPSLQDTVCQFPTNAPSL